MYLTIDSIHKSFDEGENRAEVLRGISCSVEKGNICVLLGPSGSGKSTPRSRTCEDTQDGGGTAPAAMISRVYF